MEATPEEIREQLFSFRNVVCEAALSCSFPDLIIPALITQGRCEPRLFPAAVGRLYITGCTVSIFSQGRIMVMGSTSEHDSYMASVLLADMINRMIPGMNTRVTMFRVVNRVASVMLKFDLDMDRLTYHFRWSGLWEPTSFPGFKLEQKDLNCTFVIFPKNATVNIAGSYSVKQLPAIARRLEMLRRFKKHTS